MAPEVVEQTGASTASDIWSVGALVVELLTGKPPYFFLDPMPALFRIVNDDCPPVPDGVSAAVRDFLTQCFQKDANLRVSARKLLRHPWILAASKQAEQTKRDQVLLISALRQAAEKPHGASSNHTSRECALLEQDHRRYSPDGGSGLSGQARPPLDEQKLRKKRSKELLSALKPRPVNIVGSSVPSTPIRRSTSTLGRVDRGSQHKWTRPEAQEENWENDFVETSGHSAAESSRWIS